MSNITTVKVQSILVPRSWGLKKAKSWVLQHNFKVKKIDKTLNFYRFRQLSPANYMYFTVPLVNGVELVMRK